MIKAATLTYWRDVKMAEHGQRKRGGLPKRTQKNVRKRRPVQNKGGNTMPIVSQSRYAQGSVQCANIHSGVKNVWDSLTSHLQGEEIQKAQDNMGLSRFSCRVIWSERSSQKERTPNEAVIVPQGWLEVRLLSTHLAPKSPGRIQTPT